jgi:hypothetical protein
MAAFVSPYTIVKDSGTSEESKLNSTGAWVALPATDMTLISA